MTDSLYDIGVDKIDGTATTLGEHQGEVLLVVNVASKCGLTPQYEGLEALHEKYRDKRFSVLGFPANDFAGQEPGTNEEIANFCSSTFGVEFPLYSKIEVTGPDKHPLYAWNPPRRRRSCGISRSSSSTVKATWRDALHRIPHRILQNW